MSKLVEWQITIRDLPDPFSKIVVAENKLPNQFIGFEMPSVYKAMVQKQAFVDKFSFGITKSYSVFDRLMKLTDVFRSNPEIEFIGNLKIKHSTIAHQMAHMHWS